MLLYIKYCWRWYIEYKCFTLILEELFHCLYKHSQIILNSKISVLNMFQVYLFYTHTHTQIHHSVNDVLCLYTCLACVLISPQETQVKKLHFTVLPNLCSEINISWLGNQNRTEIREKISITFLPIENR